LPKGRSGKAHLERLGTALIAAFVMREKGEDDIDAGPRMLGEVLGGLADAVARARLRQNERHVGRTE
jgi:hypothetical protein